VAGEDDHCRRSRASTHTFVFDGMASSGWMCSMMQSSGRFSLRISENRQGERTQWGRERRKTLLYAHLGLAERGMAKLQAKM
jgi:hypothetical protein